MRADFILGEWVVRPRRGYIQRGEETVHIHPRPMEVLECLADANGEVVTRDELFEKVWKGVIVTDDALTQCVAELRKAFDDSAKTPKIIKTIPRVGFCLVPPVRELDDERKETRNSLMFLTIAALAAAAVFLAFYIPGRFEVEVREDASIAVLPFVNMSSDPDQEYFSDGISEELINLLATIPELKVISRTSAFSFKGRRVDISTIAEELKVSHIVEGSVRTDGNRIRITAQLVDAHSDDHLWSQTYDRDFEEIFAIQDEIARHVVDNVKVMLQGRYPRSAPADPEAYRLYLLGRFNVRKWTPQSLQESLEYFRKSIAIDPEYAPAYVGLASYYGASSYFGYMPSREANERKLEVLSKASQIDPDLAEVHRSFASLDFYFNWEWEKAENGFRRAISLNPNYAHAYQTFAWYLTAMGRFEEALEMARKASELEPLSENMHMTLSNVFYMSGNPDEAISSLKIALALNPHKPMILAELGWCYVQKEMFKEAVEYSELALASSPGDVALLWMLGHAYAVGGDHDRAREILARLHALDQDGYVMPWAFAIIHVGLGETELSLDWLEKSFQSRDNWMVYAGVDPRLDPLRSEPRFQDLLERMNYPDQDVKTHTNR